MTMPEPPTAAETILFLREHYTEEKTRERISAPLSRPHRHLITHHQHPDWHEHCDPSKPGHKPCDQPHWHFWWRHAHA